MKLLLIFVVFFYSNNLSAMQVSCDSPESYFETADIVFVGTVTNNENIEQENYEGVCWTQEQGSKCGSKIVTIEMDRSLKGEFRKSTTVSAGDGCYCVDPYLEEGEKYIIFAIKSDGAAQYSSMNACATTPYDEHSLKR